MTMMRVLLVPLLAAILFPAVTLEGQAGAQDTDQLSRQEMLQRLHAQFEARIAEELELTEEQRELLPQVMAEFGQARGELTPLRMSFMARVGHLLVHDGPEDEAMALIREGRMLRERESQLLLNEEERLLETLRPSQVLLLQVIRDQFGDYVRALSVREHSEWFRGPEAWVPGQGQQSDP